MFLSLHLVERATSNAGVSFSTFFLMPSGCCFREAFEGREWCDLFFVEGFSISLKWIGKLKWVPKSSHIFENAGLVLFESLTGVKSRRCYWGGTHQSFSHFNGLHIHSTVLMQNMNKISILSWSSISSMLSSWHHLMCQMGGFKF